MNLDTSSWARAWILKFAHSRALPRTAAIEWAPRQRFIVEHQRCPEQAPTCLGAACSISSTRGDTLTTASCSSRNAETAASPAGDSRRIGECGPRAVGAFALRRPPQLLENPCRAEMFRRGSPGHSPSTSPANCIGSKSPKGARPNPKRARRGLRFVANVCPSIHRRSNAPTLSNRRPQRRTVMRVPKRHHRRHDRSAAPCVWHEGDSAAPGTSSCRVRNPRRTADDRRRRRRSQRIELGGNALRQPAARTRRGRGDGCVVQASSSRPSASAPPGSRSRSGLGRAR